MVCHPPKLASPEEPQNAVPYILTYSYLSHLKNQSNPFPSNSFELLFEKQTPYGAKHATVPIAAATVGAEHQRTIGSN